MESGTKEGPGQPPQQLPSDFAWSRIGQLAAPGAPSSRRSGPPEPYTIPPRPVLTKKCRTCDWPRGASSEAAAPLNASWGYTYTSRVMPV